MVLPTSYLKISHTSAAGHQLAVTALRLTPWMESVCSLTCFSAMQLEFLKAVSLAN